MHIHQLYRACCNAVDKHNSKRQERASFQDTWKTHKWWLRDFQMLFGISEVNAYLLYTKFRKDSNNMSIEGFRVQKGRCSLNSASPTGDDGERAKGSHTRTLSKLKAHRRAHPAQCPWTRPWEEIPLSGVLCSMQGESYHILRLL